MSGIPGFIKNISTLERTKVANFMRWKSIVPSALGILEPINAHVGKLHGFSMLFIC